MKRDDFNQAVKKMVDTDSSYRENAYHFVAEAVSRTAEKIREASPAAGRHIRGQELLEGIRRIALETFGPLTLDVLTEWGITRTEDFGAIVFRMVDKGLLGSSSEDSPADFADGYPFSETFYQPFILKEDETLPELPKIK
ncbi:MAG: hypothetical protein RRC34_07225 [Lentisphaeria bacterium]|nr:hypothetical protein [Lentisphaeria bacterium]